MTANVLGSEMKFSQSDCQTREMFYSVQRKDHFYLKTVTDEMCDGDRWCVFVCVMETDES